MECSIEMILASLLRNEIIREGLHYFYKNGFTQSRFLFNVSGNL